MQISGTITSRPQQLKIIWWDALNHSERVETIQGTFPSWEAVIAWASAQRDTPIIIEALQ